MVEIATAGPLSPMVPSLLLRRANPKTERPPCRSPSSCATSTAGETGWFSSPAVVDLDGDGKKEIVAPLYSTFVFDGATGKQLAKGTATQGRVYAPGVVADLDGDGTTEIVVGGNKGTVAAYDYKIGQLDVKTGWPALHVERRASPGSARHGRGRSRRRRQDRGRRHHDEHREHRRAGLRVLADGKLFQPAGSGDTGVAALQPARRGRRQGLQRRRQHGLRLLRRERRHRQHRRRRPSSRSSSPTTTTRSTRSSPTARRSSRRPWYTNPDANMFLGKRMGWGQFIRWVDPNVEDNHYHDDPSGPYPRSRTTCGCSGPRRRPNVVDIERRRQERGRRHSQRRAARALRDAGLRVHGARRRVRRRLARGAAPRGLRDAARSATSRPVRRSATTTRRAAFPRRPSRTSSATRSPEIVAPHQRRLRLRDRPGRAAPVALRLRARARRRRSPPRSPSPI